MNVDCRATNSIKICVNKIFGNKNSVNLDIAKTICSFSHSSIVRYGSVFQSYAYNFFIVNLVKSPFWVEITHLPPVSIALTDFGRFVMIPQWAKASSFHKKKVFDPFGRPYLKKRGRKYWLKAAL